jgi:hypothetical protein
MALSNPQNGWRFSQGVEWVREDLVRVPFGDLKEVVQNLEVEGFTEVFLQNPATGERIVVTL